MTEIAGVLLVVPPGDPGGLIADEPIGPCGSGGARMPVAVWGADYRNALGDALGDAVIVDHCLETFCAWFPADRWTWARDLTRYPDLPRALVLAWDGVILRDGVERASNRGFRAPPGSLYTSLGAWRFLVAALIADCSWARDIACRVVAVDTEGQEVVP